MALIAGMALGSFGLPAFFGDGPEDFVVSADELAGTENQTVDQKDQTTAKTGEQKDQTAVKAEDQTTAKTGEQKDQTAVKAEDQTTAKTGEQKDQTPAKAEDQKTSADQKDQTPAKAEDQKDQTTVKAEDQKTSADQKDQTAVKAEDQKTSADQKDQAAVKSENQKTSADQKDQTPAKTEQKDQAAVKAEDQKTSADQKDQTPAETEVPVVLKMAPKDAELPDTDAKDSELLNAVSDDDEIPAEGNADAENGEKDENTEDNKTEDDKTDESDKEDTEDQADGGRVIRSAFLDSVGIKKDETLSGKVMLEGNPVSDSGNLSVCLENDEVYDVTGYGEITVTSSNENVATASSATEEGKLTLTFTPGSLAGTTVITVTADVKYGTEEGAHQTVTFTYLVSGRQGTNNAVSRSVKYDLSTSEATWSQKDTFNGHYGVRESLNVGIINHVGEKFFYAHEILDITVDTYDESIAKVEFTDFTTPGAEKDALNITDLKGVNLKVTGLNPGETIAVVTPKFDVPVRGDGDTVYNDTRIMPNVVHIKVDGVEKTTDYELIYDANGGTMEDGKTSVWSEKRTVTDETQRFVLKDETVVREGYVFKGWADTKDAAEANIPSGSRIDLTKDNPVKTVYAVWEKDTSCTYRIDRVYKVNGETVKTETGAEETGELDDTLTGSTLNEKHPDWSVYTVNGEEKTFTYEGSNPDVLTLAEDKENVITLTYAYERSYTVIYRDGADGSVFAEEKHESLKANDKTPGFDGKTEREGYEFTGWSPAVKETLDTDIADENGEIVYAATWKAKEVSKAVYRVIYTDGVDGEEIFKDQIFDRLNEGDKTPAFNGTPKREGYTFEGWSPSVHTDIHAGQADDEGVIRYAATWEKAEKTFTVTYTDGVDGEEIFADQTTKDLKEGDKTPAYKETPKREGYTFEGWSPSVNETVREQNAKDGIITYTATWEKAAETFTVTYTDGVSSREIFADQTTKDLKEGDKTPAFKGTPKREGYTFTGWTPSVKDTVREKDATNGVITYKAVWKQVQTTEKTFTVTYTDGVRNEEIFANQVTRDLKSGDKTPAFSGTPKRNGYRFTGWSPAVTDTVTKNVVYTAQWEKESAAADNTKTTKTNTTQAKTTEVVKTGENTYLITAVLGLVLLSGACFVFVTKTEKGRKLLAKIRKISDR